jgi:predicted  nucleic acid-binding Zn-ribbon protein
MQKSDLLMQELFGELATKTMVIYQLSREEKKEKEEDLRFEMRTLNDKIENLESARDRLLEELKQASGELALLKKQLEEQRYSTDMYCRFWREEREKNKKPDAATSDCCPGKG